jgi:hypothetical protein
MIVQAIIKPINVALRQLVYGKNRCYYINYNGLQRFASLVAFLQKHYRRVKDWRWVAIGGSRCTNVGSAQSWLYA